MLLALIRAAGHELKSLAPSTPTTTPTKSSLPSIGAAFDAAFIPARAAEFADESEMKIGPIEIKGSITASIEYRSAPVDARGRGHRTAAAFCGRGGTCSRRTYFPH